MSAPVVAVVLAEHVGMMLQEIERSLDFCKVRIEHSQYTTNPFHCWIKDGIAEFHGEDADAGRALMNANCKRQSWIDRQARRGAAVIERAPSPSPAPPEQVTAQTFGDGLRRKADHD